MRSQKLILTILTFLMVEGSFGSRLAAQPRPERVALTGTIAEAGTEEPGSGITVQKQGKDQEKEKRPKKPDPPSPKPPDPPGTPPEEESKPPPGPPPQAEPEPPSSPGTPPEGEPSPPPRPPSGTEPQPPSSPKPPPGTEPQPPKPPGTPPFAPSDREGNSVFDKSKERGKEPQEGKGPKPPPPKAPPKVGPAGQPSSEPKRSYPPGFPPRSTPPPGEDAGPVRDRERGPKRPFPRPPLQDPLPFPRPDRPPGNPRFPPPSEAPPPAAPADSRSDGSSGKGRLPGPRQPLASKPKDPRGEALNNVRYGWLAEVPDRIMHHVRPGQEVQVYYPQEATPDIQVRAEGFDELTRDTFDRVETVLFEWRQVYGQSEDSFYAQAEHLFVDRQGEKHIVYLDYHFQRDPQGNNWSIAQVYLTPGPLEPRSLPLPGLREQRGPSRPETPLETRGDRSPLSLIVPAKVTVEASATGGAPAIQPAIAAFLAGATATPGGPVAPVITHNAPAFFPRGITTVTFTATDPGGNTTRRAGTVTVVDTTAPEITLKVLQKELDPSHPGLVLAATVEVTDLCDPDPTVTIEVTSNEAIQGWGLTIIGTKTYAKHLPQPSVAHRAAGLTSDPHLLWTRSWSPPARSHLLHPRSRKRPFT